MNAPFKPLIRLSLLTVSVLALFVAAGCSPAEEKKAEAVIRPVKVVEAAVTGTSRRLTYSGSVKARTDMALGFRVPGKIVARHVDVGDRVQSGQALLTLDTADLELAVARAEADLAAATQGLATAETELKRTETLRKQDIVAQTSLDQRKLAFEQASATQRSAETALAQARNQLAYAALSSDKPGVVTAVNADIGQVMAAGSPAVSVAVDGDRDVLIAVPETEIAGFAPGGEVEISLYAGQGETLKGEIREIAASADPVSRTFAVRIQLPDDPAVRIGMTASVSVTVKAADDGITLPVAALAERDGKPVVWLVDRATDTVSARPVTVAGYADNGVRISAGVKPGDWVVAAGTQFMTDKLKVRPEAAGKELASADKG